MGTRNLTCIKKNGEYVLAKYCQWDGYYEGQGQIITDFLRTPGNIEKLCERADSLRFISADELKQKWTECGADTESPWVSWDVANEFRKKYPELSRDTGGAILEMICNSEGEFYTINDIDFAADGLFCEFAYVIDFDQHTFSWYEGFNGTPLESLERFAFLNEKAENGYSPVKEIRAVPLESKSIPNYDEMNQNESEED